MRIGYFLEDKVSKPAGGLDMQVAVAEKGWQNTANLHGNILDFIVLDGGNHSVKKTFEFGMNGSFVRNNPAVKVVARYGHEKKNPAD